MIICHSHRFIFFKTRKTAGTSVEIALSRFCGPEDIVTEINPRDEQLRAQVGGRAGRDVPLPWSALGAELGLPELSLPAVKAKGTSRADRRPYAEVLSATDARLIADVCQREIRHFGYRFGG